jgi:DNA-binding MarR family transcriptional regulator
MIIEDKEDLEREVVMTAREYGINSVLFRNAVGSKIGVNVTDMECLGLLFHKKFASPKELSQYTGLSSGSTTAMLDRLEKAKLIKRQPNPDDRRSTLITVDRHGAEKLGPLFESTREAQEQLVASYSEEELWVIVDFFKKFNDIYDQQRKILDA